MNSSDKTKKEILKLVNKHPAGQTIEQISTRLHKHRITITKFVYELGAKGVVQVRSVGRCKLVYPKNVKINDKKVLN